MLRSLTGGPCLALYTFGIFIEPAEHPANVGFHERNDAILEEVENAEGFIARAGYDDEPGAALWGPQVYPRFYVERGDGWSPATLSLWRDLESPMAFCYFGRHAEALSHGREWFRRPHWPPYALWWTGTRPDWQEAVGRHEDLHDKGPSPRAFTFNQPFDAAGRATQVDWPRASAMAERASAG